MGFCLLPRWNWHWSGATPCVPASESSSLDVFSQSSNVSSCSRICVATRRLWFTFKICKVLSQVSLKNKEQGTVPDPRHFWSWSCLDIFFAVGHASFHLVSCSCCARHPSLLYRQIHGDEGAPWENSSSSRIGCLLLDLHIPSQYLAYKIQCIVEVPTFNRRSNFCTSALPSWIVSVVWTDNVEYMVMFKYPRNVCKRVDLREAKPLLQQKERSRVLVSIIESGSVLVPWQCHNAYYCHWMTQSLQNQND